MPFDILAYLGDREEMAHSLEARLPFLDHHLYDAAKFIPVDFKMRDGVEKAVLRDAAEGILPDDLRMRRKSGFMLTSDAADFFGADRRITKGLRKRYLSREAFERSGVFSYGAYTLARTLARVPASKRLRRLRRNANKVIMYMMQTHMLHEMFVADQPWRATA
jgi:asparagine synthase (glutamine-hydrolysing)